MRHSRPLHRKLSTAAAGAAIGALALYPVLVYHGVQHFDESWIALGVIAVCLLRFVCSAALRMEARSTGAKSRLPFPTIAGAAGIVVAAITLVWKHSDAMLFYPVLVNWTLFVLFVHSLAYPPTVIERIARLKDAELTHPAIAYTRRVTAAWTIFFACNGAAALYTAVASSKETWMLYNGFVAYVLIGAMFAGEFLVRCRVIGRSAS